MTKYINYLIVLFSFLTACTDENACEPAPDVTNITHKVEIKRIDNELFNCTSKDEIRSLLSEHRDIERQFLGGNNLPGDAIVDYLYPMISNPAIDTIRSEVDSKFGDLGELKNSTEQAFKLLKFYYPETKGVTLKIFNSGLRKDVYVNDSVVIVGLDYFLGAGASYRPNNYEYINQRYKPASVPVFIFKYISNKYNKTDLLDNTLLADMIFYGKSYYFIKKVLPCMPDSLIIGYSPVDWEGSELHIKKIWSTFVERELLYETSHMTKSKYVGERPKIFEIGNNCPGRIGRFLGWKIVKAYMENNPEVTFQELMEETNSKKIFSKSKFKPEL